MVVQGLLLDRGQLSRYAVFYPRSVDGGVFDHMLIIGTRCSPLALAQSEWVRKQVLLQLPKGQGPLPPLKVIRTSADKDTRTSIRAGSSVGVFVKELEEALLAKEIDVAVHSMKDMPSRIPDGLEISVVPEREDPRDALITTTKARTVQELPPGAIVGTGSVRRQSQLLGLRPDLRVLDTRGNVETRLQKLENGGYDAMILACAGLNRLGLQDRITARLDFREMLPAPGQGALALEIRKGDGRAAGMIAPLNHKPTFMATSVERAFLRRVGGGCNSPVAVYACLEGDMVRIEGLIASPDGSNVIRDSVLQPPALAEEAAISLADKILSLGGREIIRLLR
jgi:hydroxymethylbilane synthase